MNQNWNSACTRIATFIRQCKKNTETKVMTIKSETAVIMTVVTLAYCIILLHCEPTNRVILLLRKNNIDNIILSPRELQACYHNKYYINSMKVVKMKIPKHFISTRKSCENYNFLWPLSTSLVQFISSIIYNKIQRCVMYSKIKYIYCT